MIKYFLLPGFLSSAVCLATLPAKRFELTAENVSSLGFELTVKKFKDANLVRLTAPTKIEEYWVPVTTQVLPYKGDDNGLLSKVDLGKPSEEISINIYYKPAKEDVFLGVYYVCTAENEPCWGNKEERLYFIESINNYLITRPSN